MLWRKGDNMDADDICLECGHRRGYHDGAGCSAQLPDGSPCGCLVVVDMPDSEPIELPEVYSGLFTEVP